MSEFCDLDREGFGVYCRRCGCWRRDGAPECPPYVTRSEPDNARLPHIKSLEQNAQIHADWLDAETVKLDSQLPSLHLPQNYRERQR